MSVKVFINGMGVVGRQLFRTIFNAEIGVDVVGISDPAISNKNLAYLLKYDTIYGNYSFSVSSTDNGIVVDGKELHNYQETDLHNLPLGQLGTLVFIDCTGIYSTRSKLGAAIDAGAKYAISVGVPASNDMPCFGLTNLSIMRADDTYMSVPPDVVLAVESPLKALNDKFDILWADVCSFSAYTNTQNTIDSPVSDKNFIMGRAGAWNIVPQAGNFIKELGKVIAELNGKVISTARFRAPVVDGAAAAIVFQLSKPATVDDVNAAVKASGLCEYTDDLLASSDVKGKGRPIFLSAATTRVANDVFSVIVMWDNIQLVVDAVVGVLNYMYQKGY